MNETIWAPEMLAQECSRTVEFWWDTLNAASNKLASAAALAVGEVRIPGWLPAISSVHGIEIWSPSGEGTLLSSETWRLRLGALDRDGWRLVQTEFRQVGFEMEAQGRPAHSFFYFSAHLTNASRLYRASLEGELTIHWTPGSHAGERLAVRQVDASRIRLGTREGPPPFEEWLEETLTPPVNSSSVDPLIVHDLDGDGHPEVILAGLNRVYRLGGDGKFHASPLAANQPGLLSTALVADFSGDGVSDFLCLRHDGLILFPGSAAGRFDVPGIPVWEPPRDLVHAMGLTCGDMDSDGDLDVFLTQYKPPYDAGSMPTPCDDARDGLPSYLLRNEGGGLFSDATVGSGLEPKRRRRTYSASFCDLDDDGHLDLAVVSDFAGLDLYQNDGRGHFRDVTARWVVEPQALGMGHAISDFNADGRLDLLMIGMNSPTVDRLEYLGLWRPSPGLDRAARVRLTHGNRLWLSRPGSGFEQIGLNDSIAHTGWSWGCTAADFDNDGWPDVAIANGMESRGSVRDYESEFWLHDVFVGDSDDDPAAYLYFKDKVARTQGRGHSYGGYEKNRLLLNREGQSFQEVGHLFGVAIEEDSRNLVGTDLDADGRVDLVVTSYETWPRPRQTLRIFRNRLAGLAPWIGFRFHDGAGSAMGAVVTLGCATGRAVRTVVTGDSHRSQHPATVHFGLGNRASTPRWAEIRWTSGETTRIANPQPGRYHDVYPPTRGQR
jgi:hypothetical protein